MAKQIKTKQVKIIVTVPAENADTVREALGRAGAGRQGAYSFCSYTVTGTGRFLPGDDAKPYIGQTGKLEAIEEERIEVTCERAIAYDVVRAMKSVHPYEEVAYDVYELLSKDDI